MTKTTLARMSDKADLKAGGDPDRRCEHCNAFMQMGPDDWECPYGCTDAACLCFCEVCWESRERCTCPDGPMGTASGSCPHHGDEVE